jgi:hypothetical protein
VAAENFGLMNEGVVITAETKFEHNRLLSNGILLFCILLSLGILYAHFRLADKKTKIEDLQKRQEIEALEGKLSENLSLQSTQMAEIGRLSDTIQGDEKGRQKDHRKRIKASDSVKKRFNALYKNISVHDRAIGGFVELNEEMKIKAEEVIHRLNEDPAMVTIKRKVFGRKGQQTVLEVIFAYKGRLYFRKTKERRVEVLAIGTKNTQARELEFLARL